MGEVNVIINNQKIVAEAGETILDAARRANIRIPTLCYLKDVVKSGACRVCLVEVKGARALLSACTTPVSEGMVVWTNSERAIRARKTTVELIMSNHNKNCLSCKRNLNCELQKLCQELGIRENRFEGEYTEPTFEDASPGIVRDTSKCVLCERCVQTCKKVQGIGVLGLMNRGFKTKVGPIYDAGFNAVNCMQCGQCVTACPVGALTEKESIHEVVQAINDPDKVVICQTAPAVRASLGEEFGHRIGTLVTGKMVAALKRCGFDRVYDTNYGADMTIMEEGTELLKRIKNGGVLPMFTSCSPGWIKYIEYEYPDLLPHLSSAKSPHMMFGAALKTYWAQKNNIDPSKIFVVSIMPCIAKKTEILRPECKTGEYQDVDAVLTTREAARLIKMYGMDNIDIFEDEKFDQDFCGEYTGAGVIFGTTGGVMEAALRTVKQILDGKPLENVDFMACRGMAGVKEAEIDLNGQKIWIAITSSMTCAKPLLDEVRAGTSKYTFIEVMGCPGGCINGGGQSIISGRKKARIGDEYKVWRMETLYEEDRMMPKRVSMDNAQMQDMYTEFFGEPGSELAEKLLHTTYSPKKKFGIE